MKDLWGNEVDIKEPGPIASDKRKATKINGYAAPPGTGPKGETCKTCSFYTHRSGMKYRKCYKIVAKWTGGPGTDILARSPACRYWEPRKQK
jgi:hypothetical protein